MSPTESTRGTLAVTRELLRAGAASAVLHKLRSAATVACVVAIVLPYLVGSGIAAGLQSELLDAVAAGPDLHVTATRFGRPSALPGGAAEILREIPGVTGVVPRIVGEARIGAREESVVVVGLPGDAVPATIAAVEGRLFARGAANEIVVGSELAQRLELRVGDVLPPFYRSESGERVSRVVGVFRSDAPLWQAHVLLTSLESAQAMFDGGADVTSFLVTCRPGFAEPVARAVRAMPTLAVAGEPTLRPLVSSRDAVEASLLRRALDRETLFQLPFLLAFAVGIPLVLVTSGVGLVERRREAGLLRALGWSVDAVLGRALFESVLLAAAGTALAVLGASLWLEVLGGAGIAPVLLPGADRVPGFRVPWRLLPVPVLLAAAVSALLVGAGTLHGTWRAAVASPARAMR